MDADDKQAAWRAEYLAFIAKLRDGDPETLRVLAVNLTYGGPQWMRIAVERAMERLVVKP